MKLDTGERVAVRDLLPDRLPLRRRRRLEHARLLPSADRRRREAACGEPLLPGRTLEDLRQRSAAMPRTGSRVLTSRSPTSGQWQITQLSSSLDFRGVSCGTPSLCDGDVLTSTNPTGGAGAWHFENLVLFSTNSDSRHETRSSPPPAPGQRLLVRHPRPAPPHSCQLSLLLAQQGPGVRMQTRPPSLPSVSLAAALLGAARAPRVARARHRPDWTARWGVDQALPRGGADRTSSLASTSGNPPL